MASSSSGSGSSSRGGPTPGSRAVDSALAGEPFQTPTMRAATGLSDNLIGRWAPEFGAVEGSRALRSLAFADRLIMPYVGRAEESGGSAMAEPTSGPATRPMRVTPISSWLFPVPWYQDELEWLAASRAAAAFEEPRRAADRAPATGPAQVAPARRPASFSVALEYVAPSMARPAPIEPLRSAPTIAALHRHIAGPTPAPSPRMRPPTPSPRAMTRLTMPLRAWSPLVSFPAAQAAEVMAGVLGAGREFEADDLQSATTASVMEYVAPRQLAAPAGPSAQPQPLAAAVRARVGQSLVRPTVARPVAAAASSKAPEVPPVVVAPESPAAPAETEAAEPFEEPVAPPMPAPTATARSGAAPSGAFEEPSSPRPRMGPTPVSAGPAELLARAVLAERPALAPASGPRVAMPVGLGGLVTGLRAARVVSRPLLQPPPRPLLRPAPTTLAPVAAFEEPATPTPAGPRPPVSFDLVAPTAEVVFGESGLAAIQRQRPAALGHVAWADRWLARFAGASERTLGAMDEVATARPSRPAHHPLGVSAPSSVYLTAFEATPAARPVRGALGFEEPPAPVPTAAPAPTAAASSGSAVDDSEPVPDDVFAQISAARAGARVTPSAPRVARRPSAPPTFAPVATPSLADRLLQVPPSLPGPGMRAGLAASPVALALANVAPLAPGPSFDVRAISAPVIAGAYLAGDLAPIEVGFGTAASRPSLTVGAGRLMATLPGAAPADPRLLGLALRAPTPELLSAIARGEIEPGPEIRPAIAAPESRELAAQPAPPFEEVEPATVAETPAEQVAFEEAEPTHYATVAAPFLAAGVEWAPVGGQPAVAPWSPRPGGFAQQAQHWSVEQHRTSADLSFDFVPPELVIAARTYGFGPVEAARAARLSLAGESGLQAMASAVDMTFLSALSARSPEGADARSAFEAPTDQPAGRVGAAAVTGQVARAAAAPAFEQVAPPAYEPIRPAPPRRAAMRIRGGGPRIPRGAFLWPRAATSALALQVADADTTYPYSLAALDLIAADAVAEAGAYPIEFDQVLATPLGAPIGATTFEEARAGDRAEAAPPVPPLVPPPGPEAAEGAASAARPPTAGVGGEPVEEEEVPTLITGTDAEVARPAVRIPRLLSAAGGAAPGPVREQFQAIYLALSQSSVGRSLSPTVRAARALALAERIRGGRGTASSAQARAAAAWAVMPMVMSGFDSTLDPVYLAGGEPTVAESAAPDRVEATRAGPPDQLDLVAPHAGRSLQSVVAPAERSAAASSNAAAASGAGYAAPASTPLVETGSAGATLARALQAARQDTSLEIPDWFEAAAKKVFAESGAEADGVSVAEMTLVQTAPSHQLAARREDGASVASVATRPSLSGGDGEQVSPDVDKLAREIYEEIRLMIDVARERSGDPWQS